MKDFLMVIVWVAVAVGCVWGLLALVTEPASPKPPCQNLKTGTRVVVTAGYYENIEGTIIGHKGDEDCHQALRIEYRGKWFSPTIKRSDLIVVAESEK